MIGQARQLSVVIPTRNEAENIGPLFDRLEAALGGISREYILVDDSDDETPSVATSLSLSAPLRVIHRANGEREHGLGGAVKRGFGAAEGAWVCIIDADLQHPPETIPALLERGRTADADLVIATRYRDGGSNAGLSSPVRRAVSRVASTIPKLVLFPRLRGVTDAASGFFMVRRSSIDLGRVQPRGFKILMELLARRDGWKVVEVPYQFAPRLHGETKAGLREGVRFMRHLLGLFLSEAGAGRIWKFLLVGASGVAVTAAIFSILHFAGVGAVPAWFVAAEGAVLSNFSLHRVFTFRDRLVRENLAGLAQRALIFHGSVAMGLCANAAIFFGGRTAQSSAEFILLLLAAAGGTVVNFLMSDQVVFRGMRARRYRIDEQRAATLESETKG